MKLLLDSNIWLRYLLRDDEKVFQDCSSLFENVQKGAIRPYTTAIVLLEVYWVLTSTYGISKESARGDIEKICATRGLVIVEKTSFRASFELHTKTGVKLADCLIATQVGKGITLVTYDHEFRKLPGLMVAEPDEVLRNFQKS